MNTLQHTYLNTVQNSVFSNLESNQHASGIKSTTDNSVPAAYSQEPKTPAQEERGGLSKGLQATLLQRTFKTLEKVKASNDINIAKTAQQKDDVSNPHNGIASDTEFLASLDLTPLPNEPVLFSVDDGDVNEICYNDVQQGDIGDCFLLASIAALAKSSPETIRNMITENWDQNGKVASYTVTLNKFVIKNEIGIYQKYPVEVSLKEINDQGAQLADKNEQWVQVIEKAYIKMVGGQSTFAEGGYPDEVFTALTGRSSRTYNFNPDFQDSYKFEKMQKDLENKKNIVVAVKEPKVKSGKGAYQTPYQLTPEHAYMISGVYTDSKGQKMIRLYNPWGLEHPKPIPYKDMAKCFLYVTVN